MKLTLVGQSWLLFGVSMVLWLALTGFESALVGISLGAERLITFLGLVLLPAIGAVFAMMSLLRKEGQAWLAVLGVVFNTLFALFHLIIVFIAG